MDQEEGLEEHLRAIQEEASNLRALIDHPGWKMVLTYAEGQVQNRMPEALQKVDNLLELPGKEYSKGEIQGIQLFMQIPGLVITDLEERILKLEEELDYAAGERTITDGVDYPGAAIDSAGDFDPPV